MPAASPVAVEEQLVDGIARVIFALKFVQPLNERYDWSGAGTTPVVTELTRTTCGRLDGQLVCWAAASAAEAMRSTPWPYAYSAACRASEELLSAPSAS